MLLPFVLVSLFLGCEGQHKSALHQVWHHPCNVVSQNFSGIFQVAAGGKER